MSRRNYLISEPGPMWNRVREEMEKETGRQKLTRKKKSWTLERREMGQKYHRAHAAGNLMQKEIRNVST